MNAPLRTAICALGPLLLLAAGLHHHDARADEHKPLSVAQSEADPMLPCARIADVKAQLRCFDEVKRGRSVQRARASRETPRPNVEAPTETPSAKPAQTFDGGGADESRHLDRYAQEIARELGKEMYLEDYPRRAREEGRGGTTELLLRIDSNAELTDISVARSSGYADLDQFALSKVAHLTLPRVPKTIRSPVFTVRLPITFAIRASPR